MTQSIDRELSRRGFFGAVAGAAAGGAALTHGDKAHAFSLLRKDPAPTPDRTVPTQCEVCFWRCGLEAKTKGNRILELAGHPDYPNANGRLCARGNAGAAFLQDEDRLKYPMVRVGKRGEGRFERVSWKTAYATIKQGFDRIKETYGPQALALFYHGASGSFLRQMMVAYGSPNFAASSYAQCKGARNVGYKATFGTKLASPEPLDFDNTKCMVFFGSHLGENAHNSQVQEFVEAKARGAKLIVLDPRFSTPAGRADIWMSVRPGSDLAVILAWIHLLIAEGTYDKEFVSRHCTGFEALAAHVADFTPDWAATEAGVSVEDIVAAYRLMRDAMPAVLVHPGRFTAWYGEADTQRARGQAILTALLGAWWRPGGIYRTEKPEVADFPGPDYPDLQPHVDQAAGRFPLAQEVTTTGIREATITGTPYPVKGWFVHGMNMPQSIPNFDKTEEAIEKLDFLVVCDILPMAITKYADVLLPEDIYLERYDDLHLGATKTPYIGLRQPVVKSPYDTRPGWQIAKELGKELGVGDFFAFDTFEEYLETRLKGSGTTLAELKKNGIYFPERKTPLYLGDDEPFHFHTPSGKIELFSETLANAGFDPLPIYKPQQRPPKGRLRLLFGRSPLHSFSRTANNPILYDIVPGNCLWIHPKCAQKLGLKKGSHVVVENDKGNKTNPMPLKVTKRIPEKNVYMYHGFGHTAEGLSRACCAGGNDTALIRDYAVDPISGANGMRTEFVKVRPADPTEEVYLCDVQ
ncbi:MAG: molybdopterin-dependent oxidoreductase [Myxococcota bacterium]|nr:molybdopterin-dependent oxidoreductase [Myxococcota bacterium]